MSKSQCVSNESQSVRPTPEDDDYWAEKRQAPRFHVHYRCWIERESMTLLGTAVNLSRGGVFLRVPALMATGRQLSLRLETSSGQINAQGLVVWAAAGDSCPCGPGLGIRFELLESGEGVLEELCSDRSAEAVR